MQRNKGRTGSIPEPLHRKNLVAPFDGTVYWVESLKAGDKVTQGSNVVQLYELSGGEQQRIAIAIALANSPKLLLADEPTGSVDSKTGSFIPDMFQELNRNGLTTVIVTHDRMLSKRVNRVVAIRDGKTSSEMIARTNYLDRLASVGSLSEGAPMQEQEEFAVLDRAGRVQIPRELLDSIGVTGHRIQLKQESGKIII